MDLHSGLSHALTVSPWHRRRIRVLSLFDGISTLFYILHEKLHLDVEMYFSSEIDHDALQLQRERWGGKLIQIGDVRKLDETLLSALGRIDLVCGGSPCNELSLVNWRGRGLDDPESSGNLFYNFKLAKEFFQQKMSEAGQPFFWLFENTNHMRVLWKEKISSELKVSPIMCCASSFSPMKRPRYFWGNLPLMGKAATENTVPFDLQDFLSHNRFANVSTVNTITTNVTNQISTKENCLPVTMNGKSCYLTVNEIEVLMGFPKHYTDACSLSIRKRVCLIAKAWSVPVVSQVLRPLADYYLQL